MVERGAISITSLVFLGFGWKRVSFPVVNGVAGPFAHPWGNACKINNGKGGKT